RPHQVPDSPSRTHSRAELLQLDDHRLTLQALKALDTLTPHDKANGVRSETHSLRTVPLCPPHLADEFGADLLERMKSAGWIALYGPEQTPSPWRATPHPHRASAASTRWACPQSPSGCI